MKNLSVYCVDIGSVRAGNFGWASADVEGSIQSSSKSPDELIKALANDLNGNRPVTLGFECPLFLPLRSDANALTSARSCEVFSNRAGDIISRPWSAGAGSGALATGIVQVAWVLQELKKALQDEVLVFLDWLDFIKAGSGLYIWEAFVTEYAKVDAYCSDTHCGDAEIAVKCFADALPNINVADVGNEDSVYSLIGAGLLKAGWSGDTKLLSTRCAVIRA